MLRKKGCCNYGEWFSALVDGEVSPRQERALQAHLTECPSCRRLHRQLAQMKQVVKSRLSHRAPSEKLLRRIHQALDATDRERQAAGTEGRFRPPRSANRLMAAALPLLMLLIGGAVWFLVRPGLVVGKETLAAAHWAHQERCRFLPAGTDWRSAESATVLAQTLSFPVAPPSFSSGAPVRYLGATICHCFDKKGCALLLYRDAHNHFISYFHLKGRRTRFTGLEPFALQGHPAWRGKDGKLNLLVWQAGSDYQIWVSEAPLEKILSFLIPLGGGNGPFTSAEKSGLPR